MIDVIAVVVGVTLMFYSTIIYANLLYLSGGEDKLGRMRILFFLLPFIGAVLIFLGLA